MIAHRFYLFACVPGTDVLINPSLSIELFTKDILSRGQLERCITKGLTLQVIRASPQPWCISSEVPDRCGCENNHYSIVFPQHRTPPLRAPLPSIHSTEARDSRCHCERVPSWCKKYYYQNCKDHQPITSRSQKYLSEAGSFSRKTSPLTWVTTTNLARKKTTSSCSPWICSVVVQFHYCQTNSHHEVLSSCRRCRHLHR